MHQSSIRDEVLRSQTWIETAWFTLRRSCTMMPFVAIQCFNENLQRSAEI
jgi:hypothetical protein